MNNLLNDKVTNEKLATLHASGVNVETSKAQLGCEAFDTFKSLHELHEFKTTEYKTSEQKSSTKHWSYIHMLVNYYLKTNSYKHSAYTFDGIGIVPAGKGTAVYKSVCSTLDKIINSFAKNADIFYQSDSYELFLQLVADSKPKKEAKKETSEETICDDVAKSLAGIGDKASEEAFAYVNNQLGLRLADLDSGKLTIDEFIVEMRGLASSEFTW